MPKLTLFFFRSGYNWNCTYPTTAPQTNEEMDKTHETAILDMEQETVKNHDLWKKGNKWSEPCKYTSFQTRGTFQDTGHF